MFESRAAVASTEAGRLFSVTGSGDSEGSTDCGAGVATDTVCISVEGTCIGSEASAGPEAGSGAGVAFGWGVD